MPRNTTLLQLRISHNCCIKTAFLATLTTDSIKLIPSRHIKYPHQIPRLNLYPNPPQIQTKYSFNCRVAYRTLFEPRINMQKIAKFTFLICFNAVSHSVQSASCGSNLPKINEIRFTEKVIQAFKSRNPILSEKFQNGATFEENFRASIPATMQQVKKCNSCEKKVGLRGFTERSFLTRLVCTEYNPAKRSDFVNDVSILKDVLLADFGRNGVVKKKSAKFARGMVKLAGQCLKHLANSPGCKWI